MPINRWLAALPFVCFLLSSCMVGPNFHEPERPPVSHFTPKPLPHKTATANTHGGKSQIYLTGADIPGQWWELFRSPQLNALIREGLANSPTLDAAEAALRAAQEAMNVQIGNLLFPSLNAQVSASRQRLSSSTLGISSITTGTTTTSSSGTTSTSSTSSLGGGSSIFNTINAALTVSYTLDLFGGARRQIEALAAQVNYQEYQLIAAYLTLTTNIVTTAITIASFEDQIAATKKLVAFEQNQLDIIRKQFELGAISSITVLTQETLVEQTRATLPPFENQLAQAQHALTVLVGRFPSEFAASFRLDDLNLPRGLPVSLPSNVVRQRPDILAVNSKICLLIDG